MNVAKLVQGAADLVQTAERVAAVVRVLGPVYESVDRYLHGDGPEPALFQQLPELRSPAELERARIIARQNNPG